MSGPSILSYADRLSVAPGERIEFKVSSRLPGHYTADVVRLRHGDRNPAGPGLRETAVPTTLEGRYPFREQPIETGSLVRVPDERGLLDLTGPFTLHAFVAPTLPEGSRQTVAGRFDIDRRAGYALELGPDGVALRIGDGDGEFRLATGAALYPGTWYSVGATFDPATRAVTVWASSAVTGTNSSPSRAQPTVPS